MACGEDGVWRAPEISTEHYTIQADKTAAVYGNYFRKQVRDEGRRWGRSGGGWVGGREGGRGGGESEGGRWVEREGGKGREGGRKGEGGREGVGSEG